MGLSDRIAAFAAQRVHVLVVTAPGWDTVRLQLQAAIRRRGWILAEAPADADLLMTVGSPGEELQSLIDAAWAQVPAPRSREAVRHEAEIATALSAAVAALRDLDAQRQSLAEAGHAAHAEPSEHEHEHEHEHDVTDHHTGSVERHHGHGGHEGHDSSDPDGSHDMDGGDVDQDMGVGHESHDMSGGGDGRDMGGMHDGHGMDMSMDGPGGIPLAGGYEDDRDGLEMDVLHLPLGPVLTDWPAGLVLDCTLSGDVIVEATARVLPADGAPPQPALSATTVAFARHLDAAVQIVRIAGWSGAAERGTRVLDDVLTGASPTAVRPAVMALQRRVTRSQLLRWNLGERRRSMSSLGVRHRLAEHLASALTLTEGGGAAPIGELEPSQLAEAVRGRTLTDARLLAAGVVPLTEAVVHRG